MLFSHFAVRSMQATGDWFNLREILKEVPTDPGSLFIFVFVGAAVAVVVWFGRPRRKPR